MHCKVLSRRPPVRAGERTADLAAVEVTVGCVVSTTNPAPPTQVWAIIQAQPPAYIMTALALLTFAYTLALAYFSDKGAWRSRSRGLIVEAAPIHYPAPPSPGKHMNTPSTNPNL